MSFPGLGSGTMIELFQIEGMIHCAIEVLKMRAINDRA